MTDHRITADVVARYPDAVCPPNRGISARNTGIRVVATFSLFLDADDRLVPEHTPGLSACWLI